MSKMNVKILMVGGRRCGKTTVLASLDKESNRALNGDMTINIIDNTTRFELSDKVGEIEGYFVDHDPQDFFCPDDKRSFEKMIYEFSLNITGMGGTGITIEFTDVPGEWFKLGHSENATVKEGIRESQVLLIAIDTPYLMESKGDDGLDYGIYHNAANKANEITSFIRQELSVEDIKDHLILFVPLKCEKYYYQKRMAEVAETVKKGYAELFAYLSSPTLKENCTVAITPILSMGGVEFFMFGDKSEGWEDAPRNDKYIFRQKDEERRYNPKHCEQPLMYTLAFLLKVMEKNKYHGRAWNSFVKFFNEKHVTLADLKEEMSPVSELICRDKNEGYEIVQNPLDI